MPYNLEKYKEKRERVLGIRKRHMSFESLAMIVSIMILLGLGTVIVPKTIAYFGTRNLDDAIFKLENGGKIPETVLTDVKSLKGIDCVATDKDGTRLVITFDRTVTDTEKISMVFHAKGFNSVLLNRVDHQQHLKSKKEQEAENETP